MSVAVFISFARSGGTLVNKLLGVHPDCLVLSEINPAASYKPAAAQAVEWLHLVTAQECKDFGQLSYCAQLAELGRRAAKQEKRLVVRDWVTVNFLPETAGAAVKPSSVLEQLAYLRHAGLECAPFVLSRRGEDVFDSIRTNFVQFADLAPSVFAQAYLAYAEAVRNYPMMQLELLQRSPREALARINQFAGLSNDECARQLADFAAFDRCTGDNTLDAAAAGPAAKRHREGIVPLGKQHGNEQFDKHGKHLLALANRILGYE